MIKSNKVAHICIIDEKNHIHFEDNKFLWWLTFIWWKLEEKDLWKFSKAIIRETVQETEGILKLNEKDLIKIEENTEKVNNIEWEWTLYWIKIKSSIWEKLINNTNNRIKRVFKKDIETTKYSPKINKVNIIRKIKLTINKLENDKI